jgi:hypothetical protein
VTCLIGQQLVKAVEQSTQAEFHGQDLAALVSRPHARARVGGAGDLDIGPGLPKLRPGARCPAVRAELLGQVPVDGGAGNAEGFGDLGGAFALGRGADQVSPKGAMGLVSRGTGNDGPVSTAAASSFLNAAGTMGG